MAQTPFVIGVISDTHGLLRPEAASALAGADAIVHAGDVGSPAVLQALGAIAPVTAVRGNVDSQAWARALPSTATETFAGVLVHLLHDIADLDLDPVVAGVGVVVHGHSHRASATLRDGVLFFNPGSAGPRRFSLPVSLGRLSIGSDGIRHEVIILDVRK